ncbi:MAG: TldD/PmbA family protein [Thermoprotei archaeon]|nr:MAG: TldD/PmbA family protein [Thermoprotei archaeon]
MLSLVSHLLRFRLLDLGDNMSVDYLKELGNKAVKKALSLGVNDVAVMIHSGRRYMARFANNQITIIKHWNETNIGIRIRVGKKIVVGSTLNIAEVEKTVERLVSIAKYARENPLLTPLPEGPFKYTPVEKLYDKKVVEASDKIDELVERAISAALENGAERCAGQLSLGEGTRVLVTSTGVEASEQSTGISITVRAFADSEYSGTGVSCSRTLSSFNPEKAGEKAGKIARDSKNLRDIEPGKYDAVLDPLVAADLLGHVLGAATGLSVLMKSSFFTDKLGQKVGTDIVTIVDASREPDTLGARSFDDEGIPTQNTVVIEKGVLKSLLHNTMTAKAFKTNSTGNAGWIAPAPTVLKVLPGDFNEEELFREVKKGIYISNNWYTRFQNIREGIFSTVCRDGVFYIEDGEIKYAVKGLRIADSFLRLLNNIAALSKKLYHVHWWETPIPSWVPYVLVKEVNFTKTLF